MPLDTFLSYFESGNLTLTQQKTLGHLVQCVDHYQRPVTAEEFRCWILEKSGEGLLYRTAYQRLRRLGSIVETHKDGQNTVWEPVPPSEQSEPDCTHEPVKKSLQQPKRRDPTPEDPCPFCGWDGSRVQISGRAPRTPYTIHMQPTASPEEWHGVVKRDGRSLPNEKGGFLIGRGIRERRMVARDHVLAEFLRKHGHRFGITIKVCESKHPVEPPEVIPDWEVFPEQYEHDADGNVLFDEDGCAIPLDRSKVPAHRYARPEEVFINPLEAERRAKRMAEQKAREEQELEADKQRHLRRKHGMNEWDDEKI